MKILYIFPLLFLLSACFSELEEKKELMKLRNKLAIERDKARYEYMHRSGFVSNNSNNFIQQEQQRMEIEYMVDELRDEVSAAKEAADSARFSSNTAAGIALSRGSCRR